MAENLGTSAQSFGADGIARLGAGKYRSVEIAGIVTVIATDIAMSGLRARAELVHVPTFAPPIRYKLMVWETHRELANLLLGSATATFSSGPDEKFGSVQIVDTNGIHDVTIEVLDRSSLPGLELQSTN